MLLYVCVGVDRDCRQREREREENDDDDNSMILGAPFNQCY